VPPLSNHTPFPIILLPPPKFNPQDQVYGDEIWKVEEEIPPRWDVEENIMIASQDKEVEWPHRCSNRLTEESLQLIFEIQQKQDD